MNVERLERLAKFLETEVPSGRFDMTNWCDWTDDGEDRLAFTDEMWKDCGTVACALGWATTIPEFEAAGLYMSKDGEPEFEGREGLRAGMMFFGLTRDQSNATFLYGMDRTAPEVARDIRRMIAEHQASQEAFNNGL